MATHCNLRAWRIPWTEEPGRLRPMGLQRVEHDCATNLRFHTHTLMPHLLYRSVSGHLACFCVLFIVDSVAMHIGIGASFLIVIFSG